MSDLVSLATPPQRILLIKPSSLGDVVHALPVLKMLRQRWPEAKISWVISSACAGLLEGRTDLDELIIFDRRRLGTAWWNPPAAMKLMRFRRGLRQRGFDLTIDLQGLFRSGWMTWNTRAPVRIGFSNARELAWIFYTHGVPADLRREHAVDRYLKIAAALGCDTSPVEFGLTVRPQDQAHIASLLGPARRYAVLMPATNWPTKRWPVEHYAQMVAPLRQRFGLESVVAGGRDAVELAAQIPGAIDLAGKTTIPQLAALLDRADLVIANDSGPMHMAAALGRPLVAIFGPTDPAATGPYGRPDCVVRANIDCAPCFRRRCWHRRCLKELTIEPVLATAERQLSHPSQTASLLSPSGDNPPLPAGSADLSGHSAAQPIGPNHI